MAILCGQAIICVMNYLKMLICHGAFLCLFILSSFFSISYASNIDLGNGVMITQAELELLKNNLAKTTSKKLVYHWTSLPNYLRWISQGAIDGAEVDFLNRPSGMGQVYGPGIYLAETSTSSNGFGVAAVTFEIPAGVTILNSNRIQELIGKSLRHDHLSKLGALFPSVRSVFGNWWVGNHPQLFSQVQDGEKSGAKIQWDKIQMASLIENLKTLNTFREEILYVKKIEALFSYMDGISLYRAMKVNASAPWQEFEPHRFEQYRLGREDLIKMVVEERAPMIQESSILGGRMTKESWAQSQIEQLLPLIMNKLSGETKSGAELLRNEGVRAGGNYQGETFLASESELTELKKNPYLEVVSRQNTNGSGHYVHYYYPDVFHYEKIKNVLSHELLQEIQRHSPDELMANHHLRQHLNKKIMHELLTNVFKKYHGMHAGILEGHSTKLLQELISIHPFKDFNGRSMRMYHELLIRNLRLKSSIHTISDFDLLTSSAKYNEMLTEGAIARTKIEMALLKEFINAKRENRMPTFRDLPEWESVLRPVTGVNGVELKNLSPADFELIRTRRFHELFERHQTPDVHVGANCRTVFGN